MSQTVVATRSPKASMAARGISRHVFFTLWLSGHLCLYGCCPKAGQQLYITTTSWVTVTSTQEIPPCMILMRPGAHLCPAGGPGTSQHFHAQHHLDKKHSQRATPLFMIKGQGKGLMGVLLQPFKGLAWIRGTWDIKG